MLKGHSITVWSVASRGFRRSGQHSSGLECGDREDKAGSRGPPVLECGNREDKAGFEGALLHSPLTGHASCRAHMITQSESGMRVQGT